MLVKSQLNQVNHFSMHKNHKVRVWNHREGKEDNKIIWNWIIDRLSYHLESQIGWQSWATIYPSRKKQTAMYLHNYRGDSLHPVLSKICKEK